MPWLSRSRAAWNPVNTLRCDAPGITGCPTSAGGNMSHSQLPVSPQTWLTSCFWWFFLSLRSFLLIPGKMSTHQDSRAPSVASCLSPASCSPSSASWILTTLAPSPLIVITLSQWDYWLWGPLPTIQPHHCPQEGWWSIYRGFNPAYFLIMRNHSPEATGASLITQLVKNLPEMWETWVRSLDWEDPLEKGKATHSNILAWRIPQAL